jgi:hypothetical protein
MTGLRVTRYWLTGPNQGQSDVLADNLPGMPDGISFNGQDTFWVAMVFNSLVLGLDMDGKVVNKLYLQHPSGGPYGTVSSAREYEGMLYLGNLQDDAIGRISVIPAPVMEDFTNVFFMTLSSGLNMVSLPLQPIIPYTARSFAEYTGATVVIRYDEALRKYSGFTLAAPDEGFLIEGGEGYIVNVPVGGVIPFVGAPWTNDPPILPLPAAPPAVGAHPLWSPNSAWAFVVSGSVLDGDGMSAEDGSYILTARNLRTGATATETVDTSGYSAPV